MGRQRQQALRVPDLTVFQPYGDGVAAALSTDELAAIAGEAQKIAGRARTAERCRGD